MNSRGLTSNLLLFLSLFVFDVRTEADAKAEAQYNFQHPGNHFPIFYPNQYQHFRQGVGDSQASDVITIPTIKETIPSDQKELTIDSSLSFPSLESSSDLSIGDDASGKIFWTVTLTVGSWKKWFVFPLLISVWLFKKGLHINELQHIYVHNLLHHIDRCLKGVYTIGTS